MTKYFFIVGESSGDLHASNLIKELLKIDKKSSFTGFGGDKMEGAGLKLTKHFREMAFMGFWEVFKNAFSIYKNFRQAKSELLENKTDILVLVDYPGFNLPMAAFAKKHNIKVVYYITPQVWAWKENRVHKLKKYTDLLLPILPFENDFFSKHNVKSTFVGHPLLDALDQIKSHTIEAEKPIIALLPGSRKQEIITSLPIMMSIVDSFENYQFVIAGAPSIPIEYYRTITKNSYLPILSNQTHALLKESKAAIVTSGTATLEAAILGAPQVVCYKTSPISYWIGKQLVKVKFIALVNLILNKEVVKELIQGEFNKERLKDELHNILDGAKKREIQKDYTEMMLKLGEKGASKRAAQAIFSLKL
ncbi:MAG: lipid-A-disaccharide synthase [Flavobacteriales bacterium]